TGWPRVAHDLRSSGDRRIPTMAARQAAVPLLSVIVPMFNEASNVDGLFGRLLPVLDGLGVAYEIVCVDDGSRDDTLARLVALRGRRPAIKIVALSRNFG